MQCPPVIKLGSGYPFTVDTTKTYISYILYTFTGNCPIPRYFIPEGKTSKSLTRLLTARSLSSPIPTPSYTHHKCHKPIRAAKNLKKNIFLCAGKCQYRDTLNDNE